MKRERENSMLLLAIGMPSLQLFHSRFILLIFDSFSVIYYTTYIYIISQVGKKLRGERSVFLSFVHRYCHGCVFGSDDLPRFFSVQGFEDIHSDQCIDCRRCDPRQ